MTEPTDRSSVETFTIPKANLAKLTERIEKLNKRATKLGLKTISVEIIAEVTEHSDEGSRDVLDVQIEGEAPRIHGWQFIATLEHDEDGTVIRRIPTFSEDEFDLTQYRNATPETCDHCRYKRRRNDTYIVGFTGLDDEERVRAEYEQRQAMDPTALNVERLSELERDLARRVGDTKQVGSNCLKDFTGHESPQQIAKFLEQVRELLEDVRGGGYSDGGFVPRFSTREYMAKVIHVARKIGWVSKKQAWEDGAQATASVAETVDVHRLTDQDYRWADKIIAWAESLTEADLDNDYLWNVHTVLKNGSLTARQFGIAASATQAYKRAQGDSFIGTEGERMMIKFSVERFFDNGDYKTYVLRDCIGRTLKWSTGLELETGAAYRGSFNVKAHVTHDKYGKQTMINYPRDLEKLS
jgi:hypothetical protein